MTIPALPDSCWPIDPGCDSGDTECDWNSYDTQIQDLAAALASATLYRLTLGRVGGCPVTVYPCLPEAFAGVPPLPYARPIYDYGDGAPFYPINFNGAWVNCACSPGGSWCGCDTGCEIHGLGFIGRVDEIRVNGSVIDSASYAVDNNDIITWVGGGDCPWPKRQDMSVPKASRALAVTYLNATPVDGLGARAAGSLAVQYARALDTGDCDLPPGVTAIVRQGVSMTVAAGSFPNGFTGLRDVDAFIALWNPNGLKVMPGVWYPGMNQDRR